jgi:hypothetical protein
MGRFNTPDPGGIWTANARNPTTWNRYSYVYGDPVNLNDPSGEVGNGGCGSDGGPILCDIDNGSGIGGGGCTLDGVSTDCSLVSGLGLGGGVVLTGNSFGSGAIAIPLGQGLGTLVCLGSGVCEVIAVGVGVGAAVYGAWELGRLIGGIIQRGRQGRVADTGVEARMRDLMS